jgi:hypothetical protein
VEGRQISTLGQAWMAQVNRLIDEQFNAQRARWATGEDSTRMAAIEATTKWIQSLPVVPAELVVATLMEFRRR